MRFHGGVICGEIKVGVVLNGKRGGGDGEDMVYIQVVENKGWVVGPIIVGDDNSAEVMWVMLGGDAGPSDCSRKVGGARKMCETMSIPLMGIS